MCCVVLLVANIFVKVNNLLPGKIKNNCKDRDFRFLSFLHFNF